MKQLETLTQEETVFYTAWLPNSDYSFNFICVCKHPAGYRFCVKSV